MDNELVYILVFSIVMFPIALLTTRLVKPKKKYILSEFYRKNMLAHYILIIVCGFFGVSILIDSGTLLFLDSPIGVSVLGKYLYSIVLGLYIAFISHRLSYLAEKTL